MSKIGIVILATNAYFVMGVRFIKKFLKHYKGESKVTFYFFSDTNPAEYFAEDVDIVFIEENHKSWVDGTNSKFKNILSLAECDADYLFYFDADTNVSRDFTADWFLGDLVGGEHYGNRGWLKDGAGYDKNPKSKAYVSPTSILPKTYYYGAFFGGRKDKVMEFCKVLRDNQLEDKKINYEPGVNDESYINQYFHFNPPTHTVKIEEFAFNVSDKGGLEGTRNPRLNIEILKQQMKNYKDKVYDIKSGKICLL